MPKPKESLKVTESKGDIFSAPPNTLLIHACNCQGSWGGGIAKAFKTHYPAAFAVYAKYCKEQRRLDQQLLSTALLIPPPPSPSSNLKVVVVGGKQKQHFVGCLFTSESHGRRKDSPDEILGATGPAMEDLLGKVRDWNEDGGKRVGEVRMCKISSGLFAVPWEETKAVLEGIDVEGLDVKEVFVFEREE